MQEYARNQTIPPTADYAGSNSARQRVGFPGHCKRCAEVAHVAAHPDLGCGDVGCNRAHPSEPDAPTADAALPALLAGLTELARACETAASEHLGEKTHAAKIARADLLGQRKAYLRAHRLVTAALRPGAGDVAHVLTELLGELVGTDAAREAVAGLQ